jgi:anti-sigma factor RsiW
MACKECDQNLISHLDGELDEKRRLKVEQHITECPECESIVAELKSIGLAVGSKKEIEPSAAFSTGLTAKLEDVRGAGFFGIKGMMPLLSGCALAAGVFLASLLGGTAPVSAMSDDLANFHFAAPDSIMYHYHHIVEEIR